MPVKLLVKSYREQPLATELACVIDDNGTLGRGPDNELVLEDPGKYISRRHARIERRESGHYLIDIGSNPSVVNERLLGNGRETLLQDGDTLVVGDYCITVSLLQATLIDADRSRSDETQTLAVFTPPPVPEPKPLPPLEDAQPPRSEPGFSKPEVQTDALAGAAILQGESLFDPAVELDDPLGLNLFASAASRPLSPLFETADPASLFPAFRGTESDHLSPELQALSADFQPRPPAFQAQSPHSNAPVASRASGLIPEGYDALADLLTPSVQVVDAAPATVDPVAHAVEPPAVVFNENPSAPAALETVSRARELPTREPVARPPTPAEPPAADAVFKALLEGLGLPDLRSSRSPEALARLVGEMLREATAGTMDVLMARAMTKRESHIDMTMIGARSNNPLKFFPDSASALSQMLSTDAPAYLPGVNALNAAFDDLKAHEMAVIAGMREALSEVVQRFEPSRIERRLAAPGALDRLLPSTRKARLWDRLTELYSELVRDGDEDLQRIFGEKFSMAYQQQVARLRETP